MTSEADYPNPEKGLSSETRLVRALRHWSDGPKAVAAGARTREQEIASLLELFICECVRYDPTGRLKDWWSDGVIQLRIAQQSADRYKLCGVTWIGIEGLAPFEIDVTLIPQTDRYFAKCVFRLGLLDRWGRATLCEPGRPVEIREREDCDWAMAVELTPPEEAE